MAAATRKTAAKTTAKTTAKTADTAVKSALVNEDAFQTAETFTKAAHEQFETFMSSFTGNADEVRGKVEELAEEMRDRFEKTRKRVADVNAGLVEAARTETADAVQFANDLAKARTFADALEIQRGYWTNLFETRMERARELTEASVETARENLTPVNGGFTPVFDAKAFEGFFRFPAKA